MDLTEMITNSWTGENYIKDNINNNSSDTGSLIEQFLGCGKVR